MPMKRAYSILKIKSMDDDLRVLEGIATTPTPDRLGDVVESDGAQFKLPIPLLWQHNPREPIGEVYAAKVTPDGIEVKARIAKTDVAGKLKDRLDEAWQSIKLGLVRGLSIGFQPIEESFMSDSMAFHYLKWLWLELSAVTIPANAEASIQTIKSFDADALAASGLMRKSTVVKLAGAAAPKPKAVEANMTLKEQIAAYEAKRVAAAARLEAIMTKAGDEGRTLEADESEEYDGIEGELKAIDDHLVRLGKLEKAQGAKAKPVVGTESPEGGAAARAPTHVSTVKDNLPPGIEFARYAMCIAHAKGNEAMALEIAKQRYPDMPRVHNVLKAKAMGIDVTKAAVAGGSSTHVTWAGPLVQVDTGFMGDFVEYLRPKTILGKFGTGGIPSLRRVPFNVSVPGQTSGGTGYWVGEGAPKPVTKFDFARTTIPFAKVANIAVLTEELIRFSNPAAEMLVRDALAEALIAKLDVDFVDPAKAISAGISPASITNGVSPVVGTTTTTGMAAAGLRKDVVTLIKKFIAANMYLSNGVWIMPSAVALNLSNMVNTLGQREFPDISMQGGFFNSMPVIVSDYVPQVSAGSPTIARDIIILLDAQEVWLADDGAVSIDVSREASLQMDSAPTNTPTGLGASPNAPTATSLVSMFQTDSVAIRAEREINWLKRRSAAAQYISAASYSV